MLETRRTGNHVLRRRKCSMCERRWTTYEVSADEMTFLRMASDVFGNAGRDNGDVAE
ncbi:hypothetical protein [Kosakonia cowanii]|uniref:NrdR family transcriptional regulator n=1 Tax=Kosakonia cowanii TaxID=208223 RepID=UPI0039A441C1